MSRAFVKEQDDAPEDLTERPVSASPNVVTARGLRLIDGEIEVLRRSLAQAQDDADKAAIARASRDLRYWMQRRATAQVFDAAGYAGAGWLRPRPPPSCAKTGAGSGWRSSARTKPVRAEGRIAYTSPMARALLGRAVGELVEIPGGEAEIVAARTDPPGRVRGRCCCGCRSSSRRSGARWSAPR